MTSASRIALLTIGCLVASCTTLLGIDEDYRPRQDTVTAGAGGTRPATGGSAGVGGSMGATGGAGGVGGVTTGGTGGTTCAADEKLCSFTVEGGLVEQCVKPSPLVGCSLLDCKRCYADEPLPPNADPICRGDQCDLQCIPNYAPCNGGCVPVGSCGVGGSGGSGGSGGTSGGGGTGGTGGSGGSTACIATDCPMVCTPLGPFRCCKQDNSCGCTWAPGAICY